MARAQRGRPAGKTTKPDRRFKPETATRKPGKRSRKRQIEPLLHTYDSPKPKGARFDKAAGDRAVKWIETNLRQFMGRWAGEPLFLMAWQARFVREIFGWKKANGKRLINEAYLEVPRKAGKSTLASAIGLYLAHGDDEPGPEIVFAAFDKDQAKVCYHAARHMTEASPELFERSLIYAATSQMVLSENPGGVIKALSAESAKQFGLNLHGLIFDELFTQTSRALWDALTTSQGAREQPLTLAISTAGWDQESICFEQRKRTEDVMKGTTEDPAFLGVVYGAPIAADWTDERVWRASNPSLGVTVDLDFYRARAQKAVNTPAEQNAFRTLFLSQWVGQETRVIDMEAYDRCAAELPAIGAGPAFGGLDLASTTDLTAFAIVAERDGKLDIETRVWLPADGILERERKDRVPYRSWADRGWITLIPGATIDQGYVERAVLDAGELTDLRDVGYDPWNASQLVLSLEAEGVQMVKVRQGFATLSPPMKELVKRVIDGSLRVGENDLLRWVFSNVAARTDANGNLAPDKPRSGGRIDPFVAIIIALDGYLRRGAEQRKTSVYEDRGLAIA